MSYNLNIELTPALLQYKRSSFPLLIVPADSIVVPIEPFKLRKSIEETIPSVKGAITVEGNCFSVSLSKDRL
jgi:hypothetical protein